MEPVSLAIFKASSTAVGRVVGLGVEKIKNKRRAGKIIDELESTPLVATVFNADECSSNEAIQLAKFIASAEFQNIAFKVAIESLRNLKQGTECTAFELLEVELRHCLRLYAPTIDPGRVYYFADLLLKSLIGNTGSHLSTLGQTKALNDRIVVRALKSLPVNIGSRENCDLLAAIADRVAIAKFETDMCAQVCATHAKMRLPHAGATRLVPYEDLFVQPNLHYVDEPRIIDRDEGSDGSHFESKPQMSLTSLVSSSLRSVILGDPGGGKSTLSLKTARDIAAGSALEMTQATVPFVVVLREFADNFKAAKKTIASHLYDICASPYNVRPPAGAIDYLLRNGRAFVIFDGLDELVDISLRAQIVDAVHAFVNAYPTVNILVTSRRVGYEEAPLDSDLFSVASLAEFDSHQIIEYSDNWFSLDETTPQSQRASLARAFVRDSAIVSDLRVNPLMLSLMCGIYSVDGYIPRNRPDVYEKCATMLFEQWDQQRSIHVRQLFNAHIKAALYALALWLYEEPSRQLGLTKSTLIAFMRDYLLGRRFDLVEEAEEAATVFVGFCTGRAWVMTDIGSNPNQPLYGFTHRTFLEYFAARQLVRQNRDPVVLAEILAGKVARAEWDVVAQLALQITSSVSEDGADEFLKYIIAEAAVRNSSERMNLALFAGRALSFVVPRPQLIREIVQAVYSSLVEHTKGSPADYKGFSGGQPIDIILSINALAGVAQEILANVSDEFTRLIKKDIADGRASNHLIAVALHLDLLVQQANIIDKFVHESNVAHWKGVAADLRAELVDVVLRDMTSASWMCSYALSQGLMLPSAILELQGDFAFFFADNRPFRQIPLSSVLFSQIVSGDRSGGYFSVDVDIKSLEETGALDDLVNILLNLPRPWITAEIRRDWWIGYDATFRESRNGNRRDAKLLELGLLLSTVEILHKRNVKSVEGITGRAVTFVNALHLLAVWDPNLVAADDIWTRLDSLEIGAQVKLFIDSWLRGDVDLFEEG